MKKPKRNYIGWEDIDQQNESHQQKTEVHEDHFWQLDHELVKENFNFEFCEYLLSFFYHRLKRSPLVGLDELLCSLGRDYLMRRSNEPKVEKGQVKVDQNSHHEIKPQSF